MSNGKTISVVAVATCLLWCLAGAGSASATGFWNGTTKLGKGTFIDFSLAGLARAKMTNTAGTETLDECQVSTVRGNVSSAGGSGFSVFVSLGSNLLESCTVPTSTDIPGGWEIGQIGTSTEGTVKSSAEIDVTVNTIFFGVCRYGVSSGTHLGVLKTTSSGVAQLTLNVITKKLSGSNFACPETVKWTASYYNTGIENLRVEAT
jgi:hypothetical protein